MYCNNLTSQIETLRKELIEELKNRQDQPIKRILKSAETRKVLGGISAAKLQYLRISGKLPAIDADGMWLYDYDDILEFIESNKNSRKEVHHG